MNFFQKRMTFIADVFPKLWTLKSLARSMLKKSPFKGSFEKPHGKCTQTLLKRQGELLYHIYWSLWRQFSHKKFLLVICKMSRLFPNTLSTDGKYSLFNKGNLTQPIYIQVSRDTKRFFWIFFSIFEIYFKFGTFSKKKRNDSHRWGISEVTDSEKHGYINV